jgi:predicted transcriptional regulator of viral defense system
MKLEELAERVPPNGLFRTGQILPGSRSAADVRRQLDRWVKSGRVVQLRRGVYGLAEPYRKTPPHPFAVANALKKASYVSLQSALAHYGMIPEHVPVTTSVSTRRPEEIANQIGRFIFRHVATHLLFGFGEIEVSRDQYARVASPNKALADLLYLTPGSDRVEYLQELRLERPEGFDLNALRSAVARIGSAKVARAVRRLEELWRREA